MAYSETHDLNAPYISISDVARLFNIHRNTASKIVKESGAKVTIGGVVRVDRAKLMEYVRKENENEQ